MKRPCERRLLKTLIVNGSPVFVRKANGLMTNVYIDFKQEPCYKNGTQPGKPNTRQIVFRYSVRDWEVFACAERL